MPKVFFTGGMFIGLFVFNEGYPLREGLFKAKFMGSTRISGFFGISGGLMTLLVIVAAIGMFWVAEWSEKKFPREEY